MYTLRQVSVLAERKWKLLSLSSCNSNYRSQYKRLGGNESLITGWIPALQNPISVFVLAWLRIWVIQKDPEKVNETNRPWSRRSEYNKLNPKKVFDPRSRALPSTICVSNHIIYWWIEELPWFKLKSRRREQNNQSFGSLYTHREPTPVWSLRSAHRAIARKNKGRDYQSTGHKQLQSTNNNSSDTVSSSHPHFTAWLSFFFKIQYCNSSESVVDVVCKYSRLDHVGLTQNQ